MTKKDDAKLNKLKSAFDNEIHSLEEKKRSLQDVFESYAEKDSISLSDDEKINSLIDECYLALSKLTNILNDILSTDSNLFLEYYGQVNLERSEMSSLKDSISVFMSHKWREEITKQIQKNNELQSNIELVAKNNDDLSSTIESIKKECEITVQKAISSQKAVEESSNRFITIIALLVSLVAIIFGNISHFILSDINWNSVVILNSSILLSTVLVFMIIENNHLFSLRILSDDKDVQNIKNHQIVFNVFMLLFALAIIAVMIVAIVFLYC